MDSERNKEERKIRQGGETETLNTVGSSAFLRNSESAVFVCVELRRVFLNQKVVIYE
jgi:hypothetical protein